MGRPAKSVKTMSKNLTKEEIRTRLEAEEKLTGRADKLSPPTNLNERQKELFEYIVKELEASGILGNLDVFILTTCVRAIDRINTIEEQIELKPILIFNKNLISVKDKYIKDFFRCCNELSLSPQSRAKLSNINQQAKQDEEDPLLKVLKGGKK